MIHPILTDLAIAPFPIEVYECSDDEFLTISYSSPKVTINLNTKDYDCSADIQCKTCPFFVSATQSCFDVIYPRISNLYSQTHPELFI